MEKGFTLLEVIIYIALLSILTAGLFSSVFSVMDANHWFSQRTLAFEEGSFALKKIVWLAQTSEEIISPENLSSSTILFLKKDGNDVKIYLENGSVVLFTGNATSTLTSQALITNNVYFDRTAIDTMNSQAHSLKINFSVEGVMFEKTIWFQ